MKSKNIRYTEGGGAEIIEEEIREPGPGQVQIENAACGICSWDLQTFRAGGYAPPGHEGIGYVTKLGPGVEGIEIGQRVCGGGFGRLRNAPVRSIYRIPDSNLADQHWIVEPVSCVVTGMDHCELKAGQRLAMVGCGFMGLMMVQGLAGVGADQLIALDIDDARLELATRFGATEAYNVTDPAFDAVKRDLISRRIDVVADTSGSQQGLDLATEIVRAGGRINLFGWIKGAEATFNPTTWHGKGITIVNSSPSARVRDPFPAAIRLIQNGVIDEFPAFMDGATTGRVEGYIKGVVTTA